jgi:class 3 adenylate cyclase/predicted ATPase
VTFDEILEQVITLLKRQGRISYSALRRRFDLDDAFLDDLKDEILYVHESVVQADDRGFTWTGDTEGMQVTTSQSDPPVSQPVIEQDQPTPIEPHSPEAERRQLTVMFSDLVDSTKLSGQLDPEDYREVLRAYQATCAEVINQFEGYIAQHLGDALLVYFGFPTAHEDEAQRAIHTGLRMLEAMKRLNARLEQEKGIQLSIRVGIHTGLTVIGDVGGGEKHESLAVGEAPNVASRIQGLAEPDTIAISADTYRLIEGYFTVEDLGAHTLKGVAEPMRAYRVLGESSAQSRLDVVSARGLTPLVGRESEVTLLLDRWQQVKSGQGQVVLLSGEAGIGKSRLVQVLKDHVASEEHTRLECRSSPYYQNTALYPITGLLERTFQSQREDAPEVKLSKLEEFLSQYKLPLEKSVPLFAPLLSLSIPEDRYPALNWTPQRQRQKTLETILAVVMELSEQQPVLFIVEDLHWLDPTSLELLDLLIDQTPTSSLLTLFTCRPEFHPTWSSRSYLTQVTLNRLSREQITRIAEHTAGGKCLPAEVLEQISEKTDGVPLFVEEITKAILESGHLKEVEAHYELTGTLPVVAIPSTLQDSLMARLDRLMTAKVIAQLGATIGRTFSYEFLHAVSSVDEEILQRELRRLVEAELLYQRGLPPQATYTFKHALIRDAAYESLLKSTRQQYHQRIAPTLEERFPETVETQPELLAHHYTEAGLHEQAIGYWHKAGQRAIERSANAEAIVHLRQGLKLLQTLPETPERIRRAIDMFIALGTALIATKGYAAPEVGQVYQRAHTLCQQVGDTSQRIHILLGLRSFHHVGGDLHTARQMGQELLSLLDYAQEPALIRQIHHAIGHTLYYLGEFEAARRHSEQGRGIQVVVGNRLILGLALWYLGFPEQARIHTQAALALTEQHDNPRHVESVFSSAAILYQLRGEGGYAYACIERAMAVATEKGLQFRMAWDSLIRGWIWSEQGQVTQGIDEMCRGLSAYSTTGAQVSRPWFLSLLATLYGKTGEWEKAQQSLSDAMMEMSGVGSRFYEAEVYRLRGALVLASPLDNHTEAESCFHQAISIAQRQQAKSLELRAATSLARLWQSQGKCQEAYDLLAPVYNWFTEGFDTADLKDAKVLLDALS